MSFIMKRIAAKEGIALVLIATFIVSMLASAALPQRADAAVPPATRAFATQSGHTGPIVHSSGTLPAYCLDHGAASPNGRTLTRGAKLSRATGSVEQSISKAIDLGPQNLSSRTTINGVSLSNLEWRMATQLAIFRLQGESLLYSRNTNHWRASTWIVNQATSTSRVQLNRYWIYRPPAGSGIQRMTFSWGDPLTSRIRVQKTDATSGALLAGASFGIWSNSSAAAAGNTGAASFIGRASSDASGQAWWYRIPVGTTYYVRELAPPAGYTLNTAVLSVTPVLGDDSEAAQGSLPQYLAGTIANQRAAIHRIELTKESVSPGSQISAEAVRGNPAYQLSGAQYGVWTDRAAADSRNLNHPSIVGRMTTDSQGRASLSGLLPGTYFVREFIPPAGHALDLQTHSVTLSALAGGSSFTGRVSSQDARRYGGNLVIQKVDGETGLAQARPGTSLAGAEFEIRWPDQQAPSGWTTQTVSTNAAGRAVYQATGPSAPGIPIGNFQIRETKAPPGYLISPEYSNWRSFQVSDSPAADRPPEIALSALLSPIEEPIIRGDLSLFKYGSVSDQGVETSFALEHIRFDLIDNMPLGGDGRPNPRFGQIVGTLFTDEEGRASTRDLIPDSASWGKTDYRSGYLEYGDYILSEDASTTPIGLQAADDMSFSITENGVELHYLICNKEITAYLSIVKRDSETLNTIAVSGTRFDLLNSNKDVISRLTTDETGHVHLPEVLKHGNYYLQEVQAPDRYLLHTEPIAFSVDKIRGLDNPIVICVDNDPAKAALRVVKTDSITATAVPDTVFEVRAKDDVVTGDGTLRLAAGELADIISTDASGIAESIPLYLGSYEMREVKTTPHYLLNTTVFDVKLEYQDQNTALVWTEVPVQNEPVQISCEIEKRTISISSAAYRSGAGDEVQIDNSAQGSKELYRYDLDFWSTSNDWADEFVVFDALEGVGADQIRLHELWTPIVKGDTNGLYNLWYQTNLASQEVTQSSVKAASKDLFNPDNPEAIMRFENHGWVLWSEDLDASTRMHFKVDDLNLSEGEHITGLKLEFGRVEKGFTSLDDSGDLAPLSYLVYCPRPLPKYDDTGAEVIIYNSASSHITRNIVLFDDAADTVETRLVESFNLEPAIQPQQEQRFGERLVENDAYPRGDKGYGSQLIDPNLQHRITAHGPATHDLFDAGFWFALAAASAFGVLACLLEMYLRKREEGQ
ncbi:MAG: SpaA isopeptide-forming pilin-related protein [Coriobacteriia bacterium]|nr:SpaA isopeptide-forming pilin-related protein [Coriobacteriia bacterium]MCL2537035.1 SpaA isopeptide-forming pilin-related protein [Coriobacteriia bacterium]